MSKSRLFRVEDRGDLRVLHVHRDLDLRTASEFTATAAEALVSRPLEALAVDLTACTFLDSSGISRILHAGEDARERDVAFAVVVDPATQPGRVLKLTRCLSDRLLWFRSIETAEAALCRRPRRRLRLRRNHPVQADFVH